MRVSITYVTYNNMPLWVDMRGDVRTHVLRKLGYNGISANKHAIVIMFSVIDISSKLSSTIEIWNDHMVISRATTESLTTRLLCHFIE